MSDCIWVATKVTDDLSTYRCPRCKRTHVSRYPPSMIHRNCTATTVKANGPGTRLERILKLLRIRVKRGCGCQDWIAWMNELGAHGCRQEQYVIVGHLVEAAKQTRWRNLPGLRWAARALVWAACA